MCVRWPSPSVCASAAYGGVRVFAESARACIVPFPIGCWLAALAQCVRWYKMAVGAWSIHVQSR